MHRTEAAGLEKKFPVPRCLHRQQRRHIRTINPTEREAGVQKSALRDETTSLSLIRRRSEPTAFLSSTQLENVMNQDLQLEIVDLGDAKEETKGRPSGTDTELNDVTQYKAI